MFFKQIPIADVELKFNAENEYQFSGYAARFGGVDSYGDTIHPGAFKSAIGDGAEVPLYWNHNWRKDSLPIGKAQVKEDTIGLRVGFAELTAGIPLAEAVKRALQHGTISGMSFAYKINPDKSPTKSDGSGGRNIHEFSLIKEVSVVDFPAHNEARVDMKSAIEEINTITDFERLLREADCLSRSEVTMLVSRFKSIVRSECEAEMKAASELSKAIMQMTSRLTTKGV